MTGLASLFASFSPSDWFDLGCAALLAVGLIQGAWRGLSGELSRLLGAIAALAMALWLRGPLGRLLAAHTRLGDAPGQAPLLVFVLVFLLALLAAALLRRGLGRFIRLVVTPTADLLLGMLAGVARMSIILAVLLTLWHWLPDSDTRTLVLDHTRAGRILSPAADALNRRIEEAPAIAEPLRQWTGREPAGPVETDAEPEPTEPVPENQPPPPED